MDSVPHAAIMYKYTYSRTLKALFTLQNNLNCCKCHQFKEELLTLGQCDHRFCRLCVQKIEASSCPVCLVPSLLNQTRVDRLLSSVASWCSQLSWLLSEKNIAFKDQANGELHPRYFGTPKTKLKQSSDKREIAELMQQCLYHTKEPVPVSLPSLPDKKANTHKRGSVNNSKSEMIYAPSTASNGLGRIYYNQCRSFGDRSVLEKTYLISTRKSLPMLERKVFFHKRNVKGETPLQVATIKGDLETVRSYLEQGADPNTKDNAGWTPLHEAVNLGNASIAELLIEYGATVNCPGLDNDTPLHDAMVNNQLDCVRLLVARGANVLARNIHGVTPLNLVGTDELRELLISGMSQPTSKLYVTPVRAAKPELQQVCLLGTSLSKEEQLLTLRYSKQFKVKVADEFSPEVTHLVTGVNSQEVCPRTIKYVSAILTGKWILSTKWVKACLESGQRAPEEDYELRGCTTNAESKTPYKARLNAMSHFPGLLHGCQFYFYGKFEPPTPSKEDLACLVKLGGGVILTREPRLHSLDDYPYTIPYHASINSGLTDCSIYIIYDDALPDPPFVQAQRMVYLPASWLMDSVAAFTLLKKHLYVKV